MQLFVLTSHCTSNVHCPVCRNREEGRAWRQSLTTQFELPDNKIDFECPYGKPWIEVQNKIVSTESTNNIIKSAILPKVPCKTCGDQPSRARNTPTTRNNTGSRGNKKDCGCSRNAK